MLVLASPIRPSLVYPRVLAQHWSLSAVSILTTQVLLAGLFTAFLSTVGSVALTPEIDLFITAFYLALYGMPLVIVAPVFYFHMIGKRLYHLEGFWRFYRLAIWMVLPYMLVLLGALSAIVAIILIVPVPSFVVPVLFVLSYLVLGYDFVIAFKISHEATARQTLVCIVSGAIFCALITLILMRFVVIPGIKGLSA